LVFVDQKLFQPEVSHRHEVLEEGVQKHRQRQVGEDARLPWQVCRHAQQTTADIVIAAQHIGVGVMLGVVGQLPIFRGTGTRVWVLPQNRGHFQKGRK